MGQVSSVTRALRRVKETKALGKEVKTQMGLNVSAAVTTTIGRLPRAPFSKSRLVLPVSTACFSLSGFSLSASR